MFDLDSEVKSMLADEDDDKDEDKSDGQKEKAAWDNTSKSRGTG
jgi:hypothetical protein